MEGMTVEQAAKELGYKEGTVYRAIQTGRIKAQKIGFARRIYEHENADLFAQRRALLGKDKQ